MHTVNRQINHELSRATRAHLAFLPDLAGNCWRNALLALVALPDLADAEYVEGFLCADEIAIPVEHGWLEMPDGGIVDPTLPDMVGTYYGVVAYSREAVKSLAYEPLPLIHLPTGHAGWQHPGYVAAYHQALAHLSTPR